MSTITATLIGEAKLQRKFRRLSNAGRIGTLRKAAKAGAMVVRDAARVKAPRRKGTLRRSIVAAPGPASALVAEYRVSWRTGRASRNTAFYGLFLEKGTGERVTKSGASRGSLRQRAFLLPAYDESRAAAQRASALAFRKAVEAAARG